MENSPLTGSELGNIATGRPGEVGYTPSDPANVNEAVSDQMQSAGKKAFVTRHSR